MKYLSIFAK